MSINGIRIVKSGQKSAPLNLSNARRKTYAELQNMTAEQKKGVIICSDYPTEPVSADNIEYSSGVSVKSAIDGKVAKSGDTMSGNLVIDREDGTASTEGLSYIVLGNTKSSGTDKNSKGAILICGNANRYAQLMATNIRSSNKNFELPDKSGTIALTSDIPTDANWQALTGATLPTYYRKVNGIVFVMFVASNYTVSATTFSIGTLPSGYRPPYVTGTRSNQINTNNDAGFEISTTGDIICRTNNTGSSRYFYATIAYPPA